MRKPHLLGVASEDSAETYRPLIASLAAEGLRCGWLDIDSPSSGPVPPDLETAAAAGALRAVQVSEGRAVVVKARKGPAVLEDLLREHFRGCAVVLVRGSGEVSPNRLTALPERVWRVQSEGGRDFQGTETELARRLRRPRPWGQEE